MQNQTYNGWTIGFLKNIHMYCHSLKATKQGQTFDIACEDTPAGFVALWPYLLNLEAVVSQDLLEGLREWAKQSGLTYRIYKEIESYESNDGHP